MYRRILVPLDGSPLAEVALSQLPHLVGPETEVILLRIIEDESLDLPPSAVAPAAPMTNFAGVVPPTQARSDASEVSGEEFDRWQDVARRYLEEKAFPHGVEARRRIVVLSDANPAQAIASQANALEVDLIVMSTHGRSGVVRWILGSVADRVVQGTHRPVLLVRAEKPAD